MALHNRPKQAQTIHLIPAAPTDRALLPGRRPTSVSEEEETLPMTPSHPSRRRGRAILAAVAIAVALPASALAANGYQTSSPSYVMSSGAVAGVQFVPLVNSGEEVFGTIFEGIPDGIGVAPGPRGRGFIDLYVTHEQSHVPFGGFADFQDSSVSRVRLDVASKSIIDMDVAIPPSAGFIRFCTAFMAGPEHGFPHYTFFANEESNDIVKVPPGAPYGSDPSVAPHRQAGYAVYLDTRTGKYDVLPNHGRHNHENTVIVPGGWKHRITALSTDDTFTFPSTVERPNLSQLYMPMSHNWRQFQKDNTTLWAFRVTGTGGDPIDPADPFNDANDYFEIQSGDAWTGEFIPVPGDVARGETASRPQDALEDWSNANNVFQFIRLEDIAYDPDHPRTVYIADTGNSRLVESDDTGRLWRAPSGGSTSIGRIFKFVFNADDPTVVDEFSILAQADDPGMAGFVPMRNPDNMDAGHNSLMVQEDTSNAKVWMHSLATGTWTHVATAVQPTAETSGIVDVSRWFGPGWWALDVQSHVNESEEPGQIWTGQPGGPPEGTVYTARREDGQLLLMQVPGS
jgi:hypothetical protein